MEGVWVPTTYKPAEDLYLKGGLLGRWRANRHSHGHLRLRLRFRDEQAEWLHS